MKIGIIGMGSIGKRHVRCLKELGYKDVAALRTKRGATKKLSEEFGYVKEFFDAEKFYSLNLGGVIVSNPTSLHIEAMKIPLKKGIPIFVEKPLSDTVEQTKEIDKLDVSNIMVGFCLRHNEIINAIKNFISSGQLGKIYKANLYCGQFLPLWHPEVDYREGYFARRDLGGGVIRTLSHEIDLMHYLFGKARGLFARVEKLSDLEIDVDDNAHLICGMPDKSLVVIELDYLNPTWTRKGIILGSEGKLEYSFLKSNVIFTNYKGKTRKIYENAKLEWNKMYVDQMQAFIDFIKNRNVQCSFEDGVNVMKVIKAAEKSMELKSWQSIEG